MFAQKMHLLRLADASRIQVFSLRLHSTTIRVKVFPIKPNTRSTLTTLKSSRRNQALIHRASLLLDGYYAYSFSGTSLLVASAISVTVIVASIPPPRVSRSCTLTITHYYVTVYIALFGYKLLILTNQRYYTRPQW
jgi:hypothetical protein